MILPALRALLVLALAVLQHPDQLLEFLLEREEPQADQEDGTGYREKPAAEDLWHEIHNRLPGGWIKGRPSPAPSWNAAAAGDYRCFFSSSLTRSSRSRTRRPISIWSLMIRTNRMVRRRLAPITQERVTQPLRARRLVSSGVRCGGTELMINSCRGSRVRGRASPARSWSGAAA